VFTRTLVTGRNVLAHGVPDDVGAMAAQLALWGGTVGALTTSPR
jgi:hypothetical protein